MGKNATASGKRRKVGEKQRHVYVGGIAMSGDNERDVESPIDVAKSIEPMISAIAMLGVAQGAIQLVVNPLREMFKRLEIKRELKRMFGEEFIDMCDEDDECSKVIDDIVQTTIKFEGSMTEEEKERAREKVLEILRKKLSELGIEFSCDELDLGELGTFYKDCYVEFMGEEYSISEVM